ncbi:MAG: AMP-binding protein [Flavobacteriaceae bacterium]|jgi:fatty-acyl-CoA synthase|nr:AMP-binding protein [Flavobacteriaceae bacterium]
MARQLSYIFGASDKPLLGETIGQNLKKTVQKFPDRDALICIKQNYKVTYKEFWDQVTIVSKALIAKGIISGDRVGIWAPNRHEWVLLQYASARIGAILVNINPAYRTNELKFVLRQSGIRLLVSALVFKTSDYKKMVEKVAKYCPELKEVVFFDDDWEDFLESASTVSDKKLEQFESIVQFDHPVNIQYTSGTTGFPKGVTLSHHNLINNGYFIAERLHYTEKDRVCIPVPFYHCFGMVIGNLACTTHGACMVIPDESFNPVTTLEAVQKEKCTSLYGVPTMFITELQLPDFNEYDLTSLRTGVMAGSPCPTEVMKEVQTKMYMKEISICYGMTETSPVSTQTIIGTSLEKQVSTVGTIQDHLEIKIINPETGEIVERGVSGEVCTRGYSVMLKYWNNSKATQEVIDEGRWMHSGDLGIMDEEGYINISGRIKDVIIRGGENISPREIEEFLYTNPVIEDVQVIGVPSEKFGEEIMAWVKIKKGESVTDKDLTRFCKDQIAHYKIPKYWKFVSSFPTTITGKVRKGEMKEISIKELGLENLLKIKTS